METDRATAHARDRATRGSGFSRREARSLACRVARPSTLRGKASPSRCPARFRSRSGSQTGVGPGPRQPPRLTQQASGQHAPTIAPTIGRSPCRDLSAPAMPVGWISVVSDAPAANRRSATRHASVRSVWRSVAPSARTRERRPRDPPRSDGPMGTNRHDLSAERPAHPSALPSPLLSRSRRRPRLSALLTVPRGALSCSLTSRRVYPWR